MYIKRFNFLDVLEQTPDGKHWGTISENPFAFGDAGGLQFGVVDPVTQASAATMPAPRAAVTTVSGTNAITLIPIPWIGFTGRIKYIPSGIFTGATGGSATAVNKPIGLAFTAVVGKVLELTFDGTLWWPSYTS